jgi:phosphatidylglycerophosphate synthase
MANARRDLTFLLAEPERRLLRAIAARLPSWVTSDHLTLLGVLGAVSAGVAYALSNLSAVWLAAASAALVVNWFGDSLDGTLARVRGTERPRYGYYLDHIVDAFATAAIGAGLGLSPYVDLGVALAVVLAYLVLSINVYLETAAFGVFRLGYGRVGPTEARLVLIVVNTILALGSPGPALARVANWTLGLLVLGMLGAAGARIAGNLSALARLEPLPPKPLTLRRSAGRSETRRATSLA